MTELWDIMTNYILLGRQLGVKYSIDLYSESPSAHSGYIDS